jgi:Uma2 family endonuclease
MSTYAPTRRFTVAEYQKLGEAGILHEDDRVELLNGEIITMSPIGHRHITAIRHLLEVFSEQRRRRYWIDVQSPLTLGDGSQPQPDLILLRRKTAGNRVPEAADVLLAVEVADSSLGYDRSEKLPAYARAAIPEIWIVNLLQDVIEVHRDPQGGAYQTILRHGHEATLSPLSYPDVEVRVSEVFGSGGSNE